MSSEANGDGGPLAGLRVVVVDDDPEARTLMALVLRRRGARVLAAVAASEALERCRSFLPDILVSDLSMPEHDGLWLIGRIRGDERRRGAGHLPAVAVTALTSDADRTQALAAGFDAHVPKPIDVERLTEMVRLLARRHAGRG
jgi:CheY-like chemotaxis protein